MTKEIIQDGSPQAKEFVMYARKSAVVKSYPPALSLHASGATVRWDNEVETHNRMRTNPEGRICSAKRRMNSVSFSSTSGLAQ